MEGAAGIRPSWATPVEPNNAPDDARVRTREGVTTAGRGPDDKAMLRVAAEVSRGLSTPRAAIYWSDLLLSAAIGYAALAGAILLDPPLAVLACGVVAMLALYRAASFIHELSHLRPGALRGFRFGWNVLVGIPLMIPSFLYEGVHTQHHARTRYGTSNDPEYLPLALMKPWTLPLFVVSAMLAPLALIIRFGLLAPLSLIAPPFGRIVRQRYSALSINPAYRRAAPDGAFKRRWLWQEASACLWVLALLGSVSLVGARPLLTYLVVHAGLAVINQVRTLVAHLWENDGEPMSVTAQYLDTVNVPPPGGLAALWAPVGLRYHALHHLLPGLPYHALGEAHRRIMAQQGNGWAYARANHRGMPSLMAKLLRRTIRRPSGSETPQPSTS